MAQPRGPYLPPEQVDQALWDALRSLTAPATIAELGELCSGRLQTVTRRLRYWAQLGLAVETPPRPSRYRLKRVDRDRPEAPSRGELSQSVWSALQRLGGEASLAEILTATGESDRPVYCRLFRWLQIGYLEIVPAEPVRYEISAEGLTVETPPKKLPPASKPRRMRTARSRVWIAMRILGTFDVPLLMMTAEADRRPCEELISVLGCAGYVRAICHRAHRYRAGAGGFARSFSTYQLIRNTGPKCPVIACPATGGRRLIDRNTGETIELVSRRRRTADSAREVNHGR